MVLVVDGASGCVREKNMKIRRKEETEGKEEDDDHIVDNDNHDGDDDYKKKEHKMYNSRYCLLQVLLLTEERLHEAT